MNTIVQMFRFSHDLLPTEYSWVEVIKFYLGRLLTLFVWVVLCFVVVIASLVIIYVGNLSELPKVVQILLEIFGATLSFGLILVVSVLAIVFMRDSLTKYLIKPWEIPIDLKNSSIDNEVATYEIKS